VVENCPVCSTAFPSTAEHCSKCGFPRALLARLDGPLTAPADGGAVPEPPPIPTPAHDPRPPGPEAEVNAVLARALEERMELLRAIDRDAPDVTGELCEAALNEASGRVADAQQVLRSAQGRLDRETEELLGRHLENLEARGRALQATGLRLALEEELGHLAETIVTGDAAASVAELAAAEHRLDGLEAHWRGLQGLIAQVTTLREQATDLGIRLDGLPDRLAAARASLASMAVTEHDLDAAAQAAAETLMHLHEAIPPALESELRRHAGTLDGHRGRPPKLQAARRRHAEAVEHLKGGRLEDAVRSVRELRAAIADLAKEVEAPPPKAVGPAPVRPPTPVPPAEASVAPPPKAVAEPSPVAPARPVGAATPGPTPVAPQPAAPGGPPSPITVDLLIKKARSLAVRVRALPPESEEAASAARQIHEATELLRLRRYEEADEALSRLMRALVSVGPPS